MKIARALLAVLLCFPAIAQDSLLTLAGAALQAGAKDGQSTQARFNDPAALAADSLGNLFVADSRNHLIRRIYPDGAVTTLVTSGAKFDTPSGLAISPECVIVSDTGNHVIRRINGDGSTTLIAGVVGQPGFEDGAAALARFDSPLGIAIATNGVIYVADCGNHTIRAISSEGVVTTFAGSPGAWGTADGNGSSARFNGPIGLALDSQGNLYVSDSNNHLIRQITPSRDVTTFAGIPLESGLVDGARSRAKFFQPAEVAFDANGSLFVADSMNHAIRKISADGKVATVTGFSHTPGVDDGENGSGRLYNPYGVAVLPSGEVAISDSYNQTIRRAVPPAELNISMGRAVSLRWNSVIGATYQVQAADSLFETWLNIADPITSTGFNASASLAWPNRPTAFRLIVQPR